MPKPKPTQVVRHEIVLGRSEKEMLEGVIGAYQFNRVSSPIVAAFSDVSFLIAVGTLLAAYKLIDEETWDSFIMAVKSGTANPEEVMTEIVGAYNVKAIEYATDPAKAAGLGDEGPKVWESPLKILYEIFYEGRGQRAWEDAQEAGRNA